MSLRQGRRLPKVSGAALAPMGAAAHRSEPVRGRALDSSLFESVERGRRVVAEAEQRARGIVERAECEAAEVRLRAEAEARADGAAALAARVLRVATAEAQADQRALERSVELATLLAERLLGETLEVAPDRILALARQTLREARGARRVTLVAHPEDAKRLGQSLPDLGLSPEAVRVVADPSRRRGDLRLETDLGVLDAELAPQLARLAAKLREAMSP